MKITKDDLVTRLPSGLGDRLTVYHNNYIKVVAVGKTKFIGVDLAGEEICFDIEDSWLPYKEPKKRIEFALAIIRIDGEITVTSESYESLEEAKDCNLYAKILQYPAPWDQEKGVWYHEE